MPAPAPALTLATAPEPVAAPRLTPAPEPAPTPALAPTSFAAGSFSSVFGGGAFGDGSTLSQIDAQMQSASEAKAQIQEASEAEAAASSVSTAPTSPTEADQTSALAQALAAVAEAHLDVERVRAEAEAMVRAEVERAKADAEAVARAEVEKVGEEARRAAAEAAAQMRAMADRAKAEAQEAREAADLVRKEEATRIRAEVEAAVRAEGRAEAESKLRAEAEERRASAWASAEAEAMLRAEAMKRQRLEAELQVRERVQRLEAVERARVGAVESARHEAAERRESVDRARLAAQRRAEGQARARADAEAQVEAAERARASSDAMRRTTLTPPRDRQPSPLASELTRELSELSAQLTVLTQPQPPLPPPLLASRHATPLNAAAVELPGQRAAVATMRGAAAAVHAAASPLVTSFPPAPPSCGRSPHTYVHAFEVQPSPVLSRNEYAEPHPYPCAELSPLTHSEPWGDADWPGRVLSSSSDSPYQQQPSLSPPCPPHPSADDAPPRAAASAPPHPTVQCGGGLADDTPRATTRLGEDLVQCVGCSAGDTPRYATPHDGRRPSLGGSGCREVETQTLRSELPSSWRQSRPAEEHSPEACTQSSGYAVAALRVAATASACHGGSPSRMAVYRQLFALVGGARNGGRLSQQQVFAMLRRSGLDAVDLSEVWQAADTDGDGELREQQP